MRIVAAPGEDIDALRGTVRGACDVRLACLALATVSEAVNEPPRAAVLIALLLALPMSYFPVRAWDRWGHAISRSLFLVAGDLVVTVCLLLALRFSGPLAVYAGATVLLATLVVGSMAGAIALLGMVGAYLIGVLGEFGVAGGSGAAQLALIAVVGYTGQQTRTLLLDRATLRRQLQQAQLGEAHAAERARLAREMHDSLSKTLHGVHLLATALERRLRRRELPEARDADEIARAADLARRDARSLIADLRELPITDLQAFVTTTAATARTRGLQVRTTLSQHPFSLGVGVAYEVAKSVGELVDNVVRHAGAERLEIRLAVRDGWLEVQVEDDGRGLGAPPDLPRLQQAGHYGLVGVHERMARVGGSFSMHRVTHGTGATLRAPLADHDEGADERA